MMNQTEFLNQLPEFAGIFILMFSTFLIGYFSSWWLHKSKNRKTINRLKQEINALKGPKQLHDIDTIFTEIKPKIIEVMKENREEMKTASPPEKLLKS